MTEKESDIVEKVVVPPKTEQEVPMEKHVTAEPKGKVYYTYDEVLRLKDSRDEEVEFPSESNKYIEFQIVGLATATRHDILMDMAKEAAGNQHNMRLLQIQGIVRASVPTVSKHKMSTSDWETMDSDLYKHIAYKVCPDEMAFLTMAEEIVKKFEKV